jgi:hypothetical protein
VTAGGQNDQTRSFGPGVGAEHRSPLEVEVLKSASMERALDIWESEGGALASPAKVTLTGTANQVAWAEQIRASVNAEFDRVASALQARFRSQTERRRADTLAMIAILEKKRAEVMDKQDAGYFIHDWQELRDQVRSMLMNDPGYKAILVRTHPAPASAGYR